jgi:PAS domain S-box-containing protein
MPHSVNVAALHENTERLSLALAAAGLGTWDWNPDTDAITLSESAAQMFGLPADAQITRSGMRDLLHEDDRARALETNVRAMAERRDYFIEYRVKRSDGTLAWIATHGRGQYDASGKLVRMLGVLQDVTQRRVAEQERERLLRELENERALLAEVFNLSPSFMTVLRGPKHVFELSNGRYYELVGHRELIGKTAREALPEVEGQGYFEILDRVYQTGQPFVGKNMHAMVKRTAEDAPSEIVMDLVYQPLRNREGMVTGIFAHGADLTEHKLVEAALRESEARFRQLADAMPQIVWAARPDGVLDYYNRRWFEYINLPESEADQARWDRYIHPDDLKHAYDAWTAALVSGEMYTIEFRVRRSDGEYKWFLVRALPIRDDREKITRWFGTCTDIDQQKQLQSQNEHLLASERAARSEAEHSSRMKDEFLATLSHELRTPLNAIVGWSQILRAGTNDPADLADGLATIERNARAQAQIIEDLLDMSRIISGKVRLDVQRVELAPVVQTAVGTAKPSADAKGIRLGAVLDPLAGPVSGDPNRIQQILWNLLSNAIKFTPRGGRVEVLLERVNSHLEISVSDTGEGINPDFLPFVFDRFRQADASTTRRHGGLGLGLSIVKQLVELHGGTIRVKSEGAGKGATFVVALPMTIVQSEPNDSRRRHPTFEPAIIDRDACSQLNGLKILIVDDEPDARALIRRLLKDCDANVFVAASAAEGFRLAKSERPDVLISDIGMPGEDGYSLIEKVRSLGAEQGGNVPAVALTAYARTEDRMKILRAGFQMHIAKPVEPSELITVVAVLAARSQGRVDLSNR